MKDIIPIVLSSSVISAIVANCFSSILALINSRTEQKKVNSIGKVLNMQDSYNKFQSDCKPFCEKYDVDSTYGLMGEAKGWSINGEKVCNGGARQINTPINVASLERLGILKNNGGW